MTTFQIIALGFILIILVGTLLLMLPISSKQPGGACFSDCLFTATSAVCVTGLVVRDTVSHWSEFGQAVILLLIQIGGMGVVTAALTLAFISGRRIGLMQRSVMQEAISAPQVGGIVKLTRFIVLTSLSIELIGALLLMPVFIPEFGWGQGIWGASWENNVASLRVFMATLRKKLEASPDASMLIQTHVGIGYRMLRIMDN
ncbi:MAG: winged helix-turn-helix domain-containing protein [Clostridia bacterium]|nr:winged helix-turn-helix domain-containing protein [Clostridia bacterium]